MRADAVHQHVVGHFHAFPTLVAVHGVVAAHHRGNFGAGALHVLLQIVDEAHAALGVGVAAVGESVHEYAPHARLMGNGAQGLHMVDVRMHAAIAQQTNEVQGLVVGNSVLKRLHQRGHLAQLALADGFADAHQLLVYHAAGPNVHVAYFRIAHLPLGQAYSLTRRLQPAMRKPLQQLLIERRISRVYCRSGRVGGNAPSIQNHQ